MSCMVLITFGYSGNRISKLKKSVSNELFMKYLINKKLSFETSLFRSNIHNNIIILQQIY